MLRLLPLALLSLAFAPLPSRDDKKVQGTWVVVRQQIGKNFNGAAPGELTLEIAGEIATFTRGAELQSKWLLKFDSLKRPKGLDLVGVEGSKGTTQHGIYRLDDDTFTYCYGAEARPANFDQSEPGACLFVMKRKKP